MYPRKRYLYNPASTSPYKLSRSRLENFLKCPRCFYLDRRHGIDQPPSYPLTLNVAVDHLLKKEFDQYRVTRTPHPLMTRYGVDAIPYQHIELETWRDNFKGISYLHEPTNLLITGAIDDVWIQPDKTLIIADYKATSTSGEIDMRSESRQAYIRQLAMYQWLFRRNGFTVNPTGYFVYANAKKDTTEFNYRLEFDIRFFPCECDDSWVEKAIIDAHQCLASDVFPEPNPECDFCAYRQASREVESVQKLF